MITITAKKLLENISFYLDKLENGDEIIIIRHSKIIGSLKPAIHSFTANGSDIAAMLKRNKDFFKNNSGLVPKSISTRKLYHQALKNKYAARNESSKTQRLFSRSCLTEV